MHANVPTYFVLVDDSPSLPDPGSAPTLQPVPRATPPLCSCLTPIADLWAVLPFLRVLRDVQRQQQAGFAAGATAVDLRRP